MNHKRVCAWCKVLIEDGEAPITHGICDVCRLFYFDLPNAKKRLIKRVLAKKREKYVF